MSGGGKNNRGGQKKGAQGGPGGNNKNGGKKGNCGLFVDKEIKHDGSREELAIVGDAAEWYNHFIERMPFKVVERLAEEAPKRYINWDVVRVMTELKAIYSRVVTFASEANKELEQAKRMYDTVRHPQLVLRGFPVAENDVNDWLDLYAKKELYFGSVEISNFIRLHRNEIGSEAHGTRGRDTCIVMLKYSVKSNVFTARVAMKPLDAGEYIEDRHITFRIDTERSVINVVSNSDLGDDYGAIVLVDIDNEQCWKSNGAQHGTLRSRKGQGRGTGRGTIPGSRRRSASRGRSTRGRRMGTGSRY